ncbi:7-carboxy-7-deazaguanine synthase QueE [Compostibacter hankyongensis]|uniref:7-carboxy-7-deazaguanine synthase n=1 Tax=Compostibacter hankyongensis TaxID=1007089 RepID=A0ABP8FG33_9BACT
MDIFPDITPAERTAAPGAFLPLMEAFYTLQGEGFYQGSAAYFIRLGGCDVGCVWCDVKESWDADKHPQVSVSDMAAEAAAHPGRLAVVTGGEPLLHPLGDLCEALHRRGFRIHIETSGTAPFSGDWDWVCLSPKKFKAPLPEAYGHAQELKVVVYHRTDLAWAEEHAARVSPSCRLYLQPEWSRREQMLPLIIEYIKANPQWELSLQLHKYINVP